MSHPPNRCCISKGWLTRHVVHWYAWIELHFLSISRNYAQPLRSIGPTFHSPRSSSSSTLCEGDVFNLHKKKIVVTPYTDPCPSPTQPTVLQCTLLHLSCSLISIWICHTCAHTVLKVWENNSFVHRNVEKPFTTVTNDMVNCTPLLSEDPTQGSTDDLKKQTGVL